MGALAWAIAIASSSRAERYFTSLCTFEDRFVIPTSHREGALEAAGITQGHCGISSDTPGGGCGSAARDSTGKGSSLLQINLG